MLCLRMGGVAEKVIRKRKHGETSIFAFFKGMISKILYKSSYPDIPTGLPVYLPKSLSVWISKILMSVCQTRTVWQTVSIRTVY